MATTTTLLRLFLIPMSKPINTPTPINYNRIPLHKLYVRRTYYPKRQACSSSLKQRHDTWKTS
jgi:hypothetical protein